MTHSPPVRETASPFKQLLPALLLACFATVLFWWNPFGRVPEQAYFDTLLRPSVSGQAAFLPSIDYAGLHPVKTLFQPIKAGEVNHVRFGIPSGKLNSYIFTPLAAEGDVDVLGCWLTSEHGEIVAVLSPSSMAGSLPGARVLGEGGGVRVPGWVNGKFTSIQHDVTPALDLDIVPPPPLWQVALVFGGTLGLVFWLMRLIPTERVRVWIAMIWRSVHRHPRRAIFLAAFFSAVLSCFPVVFCGKSFVSPDNGVQIFYEDNPAVPGAEGGRVEIPVGSDIGATMYWHLPASMIEHRAIFGHGEFPFWNRYNWGGVSLWAQSISMLGDPLHWPTVFTGGAAWAWDFKFVVAKILFAFGIGLLVRASSRSIRVALLLTLSAPYIGFFAYRFCHPGFFALCYAPWILLPWLEAAREPKLRRVAWWAALLMLANWEQLNSGTAKESSALLVFLNAGGMLALLGAHLSWHDRLVRLGVFAWATGLFLFLSAPLWLCFLDALGKAATYYDVPRVCQIQPGLLIGSFDDIFARQFSSMEFLFNPSVNFLVLLGTAWALVRCRSLVEDGTFRSSLIVAAVAAAVVYGVVSPDILVQIPLIKSIYHFDNTFSCVLYILLFVVAGFGLRECRRRMRSTEWQGDWIIVLSLVGILFAAFLGMTQAAHRDGIRFLKLGETIRKSEFMWQYGTGLFLALAILPWAWRAVRLRRPGALAWLLVAVCAFATLHFRHGMYLVTRFDYYTMNPKQRLDLRKIHSPAVEQIKSAMQEPARVVGLDSIMTPGFNTVFGLETISGPDALQNPAMRDLTLGLGLQQIWFWKLCVWHNHFSETQRALDMLGVRYYLDKPGSGASLPRTKFLGTTDLDVVESPTTWPRAFFTDAAIEYHDLNEIRQLVEGGDGRPFAALLPKARERLPLPSRDLASRTIVPAHDYRLTENTTGFAIDAPSPGLAVLGEAWLPDDLEVTVDGQPAEVWRVDHAFRGVFLDRSGKHTIVFRYRPAVLDMSLGLASVGLVLSLLTLWVLLRTHPVRNGTVPAKTVEKGCLTTP